MLTTNLQNTNIDFASGEIVELAPVEPLVPTWLPNGMPLFTGANTESVIEQAIEENYQSFYVLGFIADDVDVTPQYATVKKFEVGPPQPKIFHVINNLVSKAIIQVENNSFGTEKRTKQSAWFLMPKIPYTLVDKMDQFFRAVDNKLGTEAIVILTYDIRYKGAENDSDGWGIIVPEQKNTAGHCNYEPGSALEQISDDDLEFIRQVGTAHSHPGMSAFASGTDHDDQEGSDGLHITFGWKTATHTEFHIEMQTAEMSWTLKPESVFTNRPQVEADEEIKAWTEKVEREVVVPPKALPAVTYGQYGPTKTSQNYQTTGGAESSLLDKARFDRYGVYFSPKVDNLNCPIDIPDPISNVLFIRLYDQLEYKCPICNDTITTIDLKNRSCHDCRAFFIFPGENIDIIRAKRLSIARETGNPLANKDPLLDRWDGALDHKDMDIIVIERWKDDHNAPKRALTYISEKKV